MAVDTAVDAELWLIFVAMIGWITLGCFMTARHRHHGPRQSGPESGQTLFLLAGPATMRW